MKPRAHHRVSGGEGTDTALSLTLQHAQILAVAGDKAKLSVALRSPEDVRVQEGLSEFSSAALAEAEKRLSAPKAKVGPVPVGGGQK